MEEEEEGREELRRSSSSKQHIIDDDDRGRVAKVTESVPNENEAAATGTVPSSDSLQLKSRPSAPSTSNDPAPLPHSAPTTTQLKRDEWMLSHPQSSSGTATTEPDVSARQGKADLRGEGVRAEVDLERHGSESLQAAQEETETAAAAASSSDFFSSLGQERIRKPKPEKPDPEKLHVSSRELNQQLVQGKDLDEYAMEPKRQLQFGSPGYQWRMMKLRKTYEQAEEESRPVDEVAMERYGDMDAFNEARQERQWLDDQQRNRNNSSSSRQPAKPSAPLSAGQRFMFTDSPGSPFGGANGSAPLSRQTSRQSFRKPGELSTSNSPLPSPAGTASQTPVHVPAEDGKAQSHGSSLTGQATPRSTQPSTPIPSVFTPTMGRAPPSAAVKNAVEASQNRDSVTTVPLDSESLNKLEAKVLKAEMMGKANAASLRAKLDKERERAQSGGDKGDGYFPPTSTSEASGAQAGQTDIQVLPTLDGRGRLYDVGSSRPVDDAKPLAPGNRRSKGGKLETRDPSTGELVRRNEDDDSQTLADLVRQEKFSAGMSDQRNFDAELANRIASDGSFKSGFDYLHDNVEKLSRKKMRSEALKRQFAINDFAKTKKALESCRFCWRGGQSDALGDSEEELPPLARVIASGTRAYLALPETEPLVDGHVLIVPIQHHLSMLEADDDVWEEVKNFMKCLLQMAAANKDAEEKSYVFWETVVSLRSQRHTVIEAMPLSRELLSTLPGQFKAELSSVEGEWSQHQKVIEFTPQRPFRRSMVAQLPYFMIQFDHKGERGYGHVIEGTDGYAEEGRMAGGGTDGGNPNDSYAGSFSMGAGSGGKFEPWFAAEVVGNLLDLEPRAWRRPKRLQHDPRRADELQRAFVKKWDAFDWTKMLRQQQ